MDFLSHLLDQLDLLVNTLDFPTLLTYTALGYLAIIWLALIIWTIRDSYARSHNFVFFFISFVLVTFLNIFGLIIYFIIRPQKTLKDKEIEKLTLKTFPSKKNFKCPFCRKPVSNDFIKCPYCQKEIKKTCPKCQKPLDKKWKICPYCGHTETSKKKTSSKRPKKKGLR